jgi:hypothetical protein
LLLLHLLPRLLQLLLTLSKTLALLVPPLLLLPLLTQLPMSLAPQMLPPLPLPSNSGLTIGKKPPSGGFFTSALS